MARRGGREVAKLAISQFRSQTRIGRRKALLGETEKILRSGHVEVPKWFEALKAVPPTAQMSAMRPERIVYPEDKLIRAYYNRNPRERFQPIDLASHEPHYVRNFARRQLKVMNRNRVPEDVALKIVEEMAAEEDRVASELEAQGLPSTRHLTPKHTLQSNILETIQQEEEIAWQLAKKFKMARLADKREAEMAAKKERKRELEEKQALEAAGAAEEEQVTQEDAPAEPEREGKSNDTLKE